MVPGRSILQKNALYSNSARRIFIISFSFPISTPVLFLLRNDVILTILIRRHANVFGELQIEVALRIISHHFSDPCNGQISRDKQCLRLTDPAAQQILHRRVAAHLLKDVRQVIGTDMQCFPMLCSVIGSI